METNGRERLDPPGQEQGNRKRRRWRLDRALGESLPALSLVLVGVILSASLTSAYSWQLGEAQDRLSKAAAVTQLAPESQPRVTLRVYNYAHLDSTILTDTQQIVAGIFNRAGVEIDWADCPLSPEDSEKYPECQQEMRTTDFVVRLLSASMAAKVPTSDGPLGFAQRCPDDQRACVANVFYSRVEELASQRGARATRVLGHAIAHEVGHLLLGPNAHAARGLMRGLWSPDDLRFMNWSYLAFTPQQSTQLRVSVVRRHAVEVCLASNTSGQL